MSKFETKDSGERVQFASGMVRDVSTDKTKYHLVFSGPMFERWAELLTRGAIKYEENNWMLAEGEAELKRFKESAVRHFYQWLRGDTDEDHAAATFFNINGYEYVKAKLELARAKATFEAVEAEVEADGDVTVYYTNTSLNPQGWDGPLPGDPPSAATAPTCKCDYCNWRAYEEPSVDPFDVAETIPPQCDAAYPDLPEAPEEGKIYMLADGTLVKAVKGNGGWRRGDGVPEIVAGRSLLYCVGDNWPSGSGKFHAAGDNWGLSESLYLVVVE